MKYKAIMAIALLALVSLMITPAMAWDFYYDEVDESADAGTQIFAASFWVNSSVRYIEVTDIYAYLYADNVLSGSYSDIITDSDGATVGNYSATWGDFGVDWTHEGWITITIDDIVYPEDENGNSAVAFNNLYWQMEAGSGHNPAFKCEVPHYPDVVPFAAFGGGIIHGAGDKHLAKACHGTSTFYSGDPPAPVASFVCVPTSQYPNTDVVCTDTSTGTWIDTWLWTIDAEAYDLHGWKTSASQNYTWQSAYPGIFSVNLRATNSGGSDWYLSSIREGHKPLHQLSRAIH